HPGLYYINPKEYKVDVLEIGINQVSLLGGRTVDNVSMQKEEVRRMRRDLAGQAKKPQSQLHEPKERAEYDEKTRGKNAQANLYTKRQLASTSDADIGSTSQKVFLKDAFNFLKGERMSGTTKKDKMYSQQEKMRMPPIEKEMKSATPVQKLDIDQFVEFPSKDGFHIMLDLTVEFELLPPNIASIYSKYGSLSDTVEKIILPQVLSVSRLKGSHYKAKDFIMGEGREKFQTDLTNELVATMKEKDITIHSVLIRSVVVPSQILMPIQDASIAIEENLTNIEKQETARKLAELNTETMLIEQSKEKVQEETKKITAEIRAQMDKEVAKIKAQAQKEVADIERQIALLQAQRQRKLGKAEADVTKMVGNAKSEGFRLKVEAFGNPNAYSLYEMANGLSDDIRVAIIHTGEGTLWTDIDKVSSGDLGGLKLLKRK
ncbi:MAG: SPFH domain-containing protein, partial [Candidatus Omnitrophota bacterium]